MLSLSQAEERADLRATRAPGADQAAEEQSGVGYEDVWASGADPGGGVDDVRASGEDASVSGGGRQQQPDASVTMGGEQRPERSRPVHLKDAHRHLAGEVMEGGDGNVRYNESARHSLYYPADSPTELYLFCLTYKHQLSRACVKDMFLLFETKDGVKGDKVGEGRGFDVADIPKNADHFVDRMRRYLPLLEVIKRTVPTKTRGKTADVFDIPLNLQYARFLESKRAMKEMEANPGGQVLRGEEATKNGLASDHVFAGPVERITNKRRTFMDGRLSRTTPFYGFDGVLCGGSKRPRRVYIGELVVAKVSEGGDAIPKRRPCRILAVCWDERLSTMVVTVRRFRYSHEVVGLAPAEHRQLASVTRVWEEQGAHSECKVLPSALVDLCEILTKTELEGGKHKEPWSMGRRRGGDWSWTHVCEGFATRRSGRKRGRVQATPFVFCAEWARWGGKGEAFHDMRGSATHHNDTDLPFCGIGTALNIDAFNVWSITNPVSVHELIQAGKGPAVMLFPSVPSSQFVLICRWFREQSGSEPDLSSPSCSLLC